MKQITITSLLLILAISALSFAQPKQNIVTAEKEISQKSITRKPEYSPSEERKKFTVLVRLGYFSPTEQIFKDVYGSSFSYGGEVRATLWKGISIFFGVSVLSNKGKMTLLEEETKLTIVPIELGVLYKFSIKTINPYIGAGLGYHILSEESFLGKVTDNKLGFFGQAGVAINMMKAFVIDLNAKYNFCNAKPGEIEENIGGISIGLGVGYSF
jgi:opacity protein-like surface antigen